MNPERIVYTTDLSGQPEAWTDTLNELRGMPKGTPVDDSVVTVIFEELAGKTRLTISTRFVSAADARAFRKMRMEEGWGGSFVKLARLLTKGSGG
ncbi:MAG: SRPBCC domain-containing protein [Gemmatimonadaceae bacterium]|nr:SRPBCC domain-containing protein [Gemmatimonadaceae bacterium]